MKNNINIVLIGMPSAGKTTIGRCLEEKLGKRYIDMDDEIIKPSNLPIGTMTDEDIATAESGHEFIFELTQEPLRYIRIVLESTWGGTTFTHPTEVDVYGEVVQ